MKPVTLHDGRVVDDYSEDFRHECEAISILKMPTSVREGFIQKVGAKRGDLEAQRLRNTVQKIWIDRTAREIIELQRTDFLESERRLVRIARNGTLGQRYRAGIEKRMQEIISTTIPSSEKTERAA
jgi:hypothetical protein